MAVATAASIAIPEMARFENSISAWDESWGTIPCAWQVGQCGHPSPDAVRRTRPPVVTTSQRMTSVATAARWKVRIEMVRGRRRESDGVSAWAISCQCNPALAAAGHSAAPGGGHHSFTQYDANTAVGLFDRLQTGVREWHSLGSGGYAVSGSWARRGSAASSCA